VWITTRVAAVALLLGPFTAGPAAKRPALFSSYELLTLQLRAPFGQLFESARDDDSFAVSATLSYQHPDGREIVLPGVKLSLRGHTSRRETECAFPKLKLHFESPPDDPIFAGLSALKIGSHCDEREGLTPRFGRLANERSPLREAFVYRVLDILQVPSYLARPARITYAETGSDSRAFAGSITRNAMLLEDDNDAKKRYEATREIDVDAFTNARDTFEPADVARATFAEALIGNFDWCLKMTDDDTYRCDARRKLWNVTALRGDRTLPLIYDFDVSGMVAGEHRWFNQIFNEAFLPSRSHAAIEVLSQVQRTRTLFDRRVLDETRTWFVDRKHEIYRALDLAPLDDPGRARIREYADSFFDAVETDAAFYRPVVTAEGAMAYRNADRSAAVCPAAGPIPAGTPVSEPLEENDEMVRVVLIDAQWHWIARNDCPDLRRNAVWLERAGISSDFPP
jgi:hypothetical protein